MLHREARRNPAWQALVLGLFYLVCFLAAGLGSLFTVGELRDGPEFRHLEIEHLSPPAETLLVAEQGILP